MQLPQIDKSMLDIARREDAGRRCYPAVDFGVRTEKPKPKTEKPLTSNECIKMFGTREAVMMTFVPQMMTALALEQAEEYIKYCRDNKLERFKRHNREIRKCIDEYNKSLRISYGPLWSAYQRYLARLRKKVEFDLFKCWVTFTNEAARQYVGNQHKDVPARVTFIRMLLVFVEEFDKNIDRVIESRMKQPCNRKQDPQLFLISLLCTDIAESFGAKMEVTEPMALCVRVLANRCNGIVDTIIAEEDAAEVQNH